MPQILQSVGCHKDGIVVEILQTYNLMPKLIQVITNQVIKYQYLETTTTERWNW